MNEEELTPEQLQKRTAWALEKQLKKAERKTRRHPDFLLCEICKRPSTFFSWTPAATPLGAIKGCKMPPNMRWTEGGKVEELLKYSSEVRMAVVGEGENKKKVHVHLACLRRKT